MAYAPGVDVGTLKIIPEASRPTSAVLAGGTASTFTDVNFGPYTPKGVKALLLTAQVIWTGNGSADNSFWQLRKNGDAVTDDQQVELLGFRYDNLGSGVLMSIISNDFTILCDGNGVIEYRFYAGATAVGELHLWIKGYYM